MASGKPFVASDVPGLSEIVKGAGILFQQGNEKELATIVKNLMQDQVFYAKVARECEERASEYDINKMVKAYQNLYNNLK